MKRSRRLSQNAGYEACLLRQTNDVRGLSRLPLLKYLLSNTRIADGTVDLDNDGDLDDGVTLQELIENGFEMKRSLAYLKIRIQA